MTVAKIRLGPSGGSLVPIKILFTGYAPVHFVCFLPYYERLKSLPDVEVTLSGGLRSKTEDGWVYDAEALYRPFGVPSAEIAEADALHDSHFNLEFAGHTKRLVPTSAETRIQIFHGVSYRNKSIRRENLKWDYFFIVGPYMRRRFAEAELLPDGDPRAINVGFPKTDRLLDGSLDAAKLRADYGLPDDRPILLYAPTGAKENSLETMGEAAIEALKNAGKYTVLVKPHDHPRNRQVDWFDRLSHLEDRHCHVMREPDVVKLLFIADLLISDASSVANEYTLLDRPILFLDTPALIEHAREAEESMLDLDTWGRKGGTIVLSPADLTAAVDKCLANPHEKSEIRHAISQDLFFNPGKAADAAMAWIESEVINLRACTADL